MSSLLGSLAKSAARAAGEALVNAFDENAQGASSSSSSSTSSAIRYVDPQVLVKKRVDELRLEVNQRMREWETQSIVENDVSVCGLYLHFGWSVIALIECTIWFLIFMVFQIVLLIVYYIELLLSCGKGCTKDSTAFLQATVMSNSANTAYYFLQIFGLTTNLLVPWNPPVFLFKRYDKLNYPRKTDNTTYRGLSAGPRACECCLFCCTGSGDDVVMDCCCCCCSAAADSAIDGLENGGNTKWMLLTVGGPTVLTRCCVAEAEKDEFAQAVMRENTMRFYRDVYGPDITNGFEGLCIALVPGYIPNYPAGVAGPDVRDIRPNPNPGTSSNSSNNNNSSSSSSSSAAPTAVAQQGTHVTASLPIAAATAGGAPVVAVRAEVLSSGDGQPMSKV
jgi:hypothetical protein